jgi:CRISPR-associated endonuclease/helicase Cas3
MDAVIRLASGAFLLLVRDQVQSLECGNVLMVAFAGKTECAELFAKRFEALTGNAPFPWQECLFLRFLSDKIPPADVSLPTGTGKTSIMAIWLLALAEKSAADSRQNSIPRRLVWVVNRRVVVDQATNEVEQIRRRVNDPAIVELEPIRSALRKLSVETSGEIIGISTLRGQFEDNAEWRGDPSRPAVIVGTVDMIGSRLLFSGYGIGFKAKPLHAGFLGQDVLLVHDEAHLEPAFQELLVAIREEQKRCREFGKFHVMALSATSRAKKDGNDAFGLTAAEKDVPNEMPDSSETPLHVIWRRQGAKKQIRLHIVQEKLADDIAAEALKFANQACAVLVFARTVEDVEKIAGKLKTNKQQVQQLTGTLRGWERDQLVNNDPIFSRFLRQAQPAAATVYLVCTSAGEVGVNISADHLICDLSPFDSMVQRFGRVNRFGDRDDTQIHIFHPEEADFKDDELDRRRRKTLALLRKLDGNGSPKAIGQLMNDEDCQAAFTPPPTILPATDILFDAWALTTIKGKLPGRSPVERYLHGVSEYELPETCVAWREEVGVITGDLLKENPPEDLLEDYPLKPHELLRDRSKRVHERLCKLAGRHPDKPVPVWLLADDGSVEVLTLEEVANGKKERIENRTVLLPPTAGGLKDGMLDGDSNKANDVADMWQDAKGNQSRIRVWNAEMEKMRLIRSIGIDPKADAEAEADGDEASNRRYWNWYERPKTADNDGSERSTRAVTLEDHTKDVVTSATRIVDHLPLRGELPDAIKLAAKFHDLGKGRPVFQTNIGNQGCVPLLAKSGKKRQPYTANKNFRHEFASLLDIQKEPEFLELTHDMRELVLHLVAAHHGRGRPHFPTEQAYDPQATDAENSDLAAKVPQRFSRLQRRYGRWGLAYLESLLRAADYAASANPSSFWEGEQ